MRYEVRLPCKTKEEALSLLDLLDGVAKGEIIYISGAEEYARLDVRSWRSTKYLLSKLDPSRSFTVEDAKIILEEARWSPNTAGTILTKLTKVGVIRKVGTGLYRINKESLDA